MSRRHVIISGTGRAGTTALVQLLTDLGLDTGFTDLSSGLFEFASAGMSLDIRRPDAPYIIKSPWLCDYLDEVLQGGDVIIDHAIVPVRDLYSAAESRRVVTEKADRSIYPDSVPGGLWHTEDPARQEAVLAGQLYKLVYAIAKHEIPLTLLYFPKFIYDPEYLYKQILFVLKDVDYDSFLRAFQRVMRPELVHNFERCNLDLRTCSPPEATGMAS
jgi:hypothetical protein